MRSHLMAAYRTLVPVADDPHGPLPPLLVLLTVVTGLVDALSYLSLGHVFVANMTGNVVFLGFAVGGAPGFLWWASIVAVAAFSLGALVGGRIATRFPDHRGRRLMAGSGVQTVLVAAAVVTAIVVGAPQAGTTYGEAALATLVVLLGVAMGLQNAVARSLSVPDLTTTVLTLTITGISADSRAAGGSDSKIGRRLVSVAAMFGGAVAGALLIESGHGVWVLPVMLVLLVVVVAGSARAAQSTAPWTAPAHH